MKAIHKTARVALISLVAFLLAGFGGDLAGRTKEGNRLFSEGDYEGALRAYTDAQLEDPENPLLHFNIGNVKYRQRKFDEAIGSFEQATRSPNPDVQRDSHYNIANSLFAKGDLPASILEYKKALEIDPDDAGAKYNLEFVRRKLKEQQEQQQQQQQQQNQQQQQQGEQQQQEQQQSGEDQQQSSDQNEQAGEKPEKDKEETGKDEPQPAEQEAEQNEPLEPGEAQAVEPDGEMTEQQAQAVLDALEDSEKEAQEDMARSRARSQDRSKDW